MPEDRNDEKNENSETPEEPRRARIATRYRPVAKLARRGIEVNCLDYYPRSIRSDGVAPVAARPNALFDQFFYHSANVVLHFVRRPVGAYQLDSLGVAPGDCEITTPHARLKPQSGIFEARATSVPPPFSALEAEPRGRVENNREVRLSTPADELIQAPHRVFTEPSTPALVCEARVVVPVADHEPAASERRAHYLIEVLLASCVHQQKLRERGDRVVRRAKQYLANLFAGFRATGLTCDKRRVTARPQPGDEPPQLRGFPSSVDPLDGNE